MYSTVADNYTLHKVLPQHPQHRPGAVHSHHNITDYIPYAVCYISVTILSLPIRASVENLIDMLILRPHPDLSESEILGNVGFWCFLFSKWEVVLGLWEATLG